MRISFKGLEDFIRRKHVADAHLTSSVKSCLSAQILNCSLPYITHFRKYGRRKEEEEILNERWTMGGGIKRKLNTVNRIHIPSVTWWDLYYTEVWQVFELSIYLLESMWVNTCLGKGLLIFISLCSLWLVTHLRHHVRWAPTQFIYLFIVFLTLKSECRKRWDERNQFLCRQGWPSCFCRHWFRHDRTCLR
jgi:hypothetical protein